MFAACQVFAYPEYWKAAWFVCGLQFETVSPGDTFQSMQQFWSFTERRNSFQQMMTVASYPNSKQKHFSILPVWCHQESSGVKLILVQDWKTGAGPIKLLSNNIQQQLVFHLFYLGCGLETFSIVYVISSFCRETTKL